jgi:hypothetical protein
VTTVDHESDGGHQLDRTVWWNYRKYRNESTPWSTG